jgi:hypothetical protein
VRENREVVVKLSRMFNNSQTLSKIDSLLRNRARRTSDISAGWVPWKFVPYHDKQPNRHDDLDQIIRIIFNFYIDTPTFCLDFNGSISYYIVFNLDSEGRLNGEVDGWAFQFWRGTFGTARRSAYRTGVCCSCRLGLDHDIFIKCNRERLSASSIAKSNRASGVVKHNATKTECITNCYF